MNAAKILAWDWIIDAVKITGVILLGFCCVTLEAMSQTNVTILEPTERILATEIDGEAVRKIAGNVRLELDDRVLACDSAFQYLDQPLVLAYNLEITRDDESIQAERLWLNTETEVATLSGSVQVTYQNTDVHSDSAVFFLDTDQARFFQRVQWADSTTYVEADEAFVDQEKAQTQLKGSIYGETLQKDQFFVADSMFGDTLGTLQLVGRSTVWSFEAEQDGKPSAPDKPSAINKPSDPGKPMATNEPVAIDTTILFAQRIDLQETDSSQRLQATGSPRLWSPDLRALADTIDGVEPDGILDLYPNAKLWADQAQLTANRFTLREQSDSTAILTGLPRTFITLEDTVIQRFQQVVGDSLVATFISEQLRRLSLHRNTEIFFFPEQENEQGNEQGDQQGNQAIKMQSALGADLILQNNELTGITARSAVQGEIYEGEEALNGFRLEGYDWSPEQALPFLPLPRKRFDSLYPMFDQRRTQNESLFVIPVEAFDASSPPLNP
ncbi:MAG: LptA/OstA family protein [Balneolaceae bacterium]|nr:LptA/OstA family protein [Balneolaceae bacterium]